MKYFNSKLMWQFGFAKIFYMVTGYLKHFFREFLNTYLTHFLNTNNYTRIIRGREKTMSMNVGMNGASNANLRLGNGSGIDLEDLKNNKELLEKYNGQTVTVGGINYVIENGEVKPASEAGDNSIFGSDEDGEIGDSIDLSGATGADGTQRVATTPEGQAILDEIEKLEEQKDANTEEMEAIKAEIETLTAEAEDEINQALAAQEKAVADHEEDTKKLVNQSLADYIEANKEGGEGMTRDELQSNIKKNAEGLGLPAEIGDATAMLMSASDKLDEVDGLLGDLNSLIQDNQNIECQIEAKGAEFEAVEEAAKKEAAEKQKSCDPIGFEATDKDGNKAQYDFIKDDGNFDSTDDFLGAQNQWQEMQALDTDGDNIVTAAELDAGGIKAVKTNADGSQDIVSMTEEFGEDFSIDLSSYAQGGTHAAVDPTADSDGDGTLDQELLGTFSVNTGSETVQGYNTLDDVDYLSENYGIEAGTQATEAEDTEFQYSQELQESMNFFQTYTEKVAELREKLMEAWKSLGATEDQVTDYNSIAKDAASDAKEVTPAEEGTNEEAGEQNPEEQADILTDNNPFGAEINPDELELLELAV